MNLIATTTDLIQIVSPWGAGTAVFLGIIHLIRELRQPSALATAVKSMETQEGKDALVEMYHIAKQPKSRTIKKELLPTGADFLSARALTSTENRSSEANGKQ